MAALTLKEGVVPPGAPGGTPFDVSGLAKHCIKNLPSYAVPVFLRFLPEYVLVCFSFCCAFGVSCGFLAVDYWIDMPGCHLAKIISKVVRARRAKMDRSCSARVSRFGPGRLTSSPHMRQYLPLFRMMYRTNPSLCSEIPLTRLP